MKLRVKASPDPQAGFRLENGGPKNLGTRASEPGFEGCFEHAEALSPGQINDLASVVRFNSLV